MSAPSRTAAVILAAGASSRMGRCKLSLPIGGIPIIQRVAVACLEGGSSPVLVVLGNHREEVTGALGGLPVSLVINPDPERGMLSSVQCGLASLLGDCASVLITPGDLALLTPEMVRTLIQSAAAAPRSLLVASHQGVRGHPVVIPVDLVAEVMVLPLTVGLNALLAKHAERVELVEVGDEALVDVDTVEDYVRVTGGKGI